MEKKSSLLRRLVDYEEEENEGNWNEIVAWYIPTGGKTHWKSELKIVF